MVDSESALAIALFGEILTVHQLIRNQLDRVLPKGMELSHFSVLNHLANTKGEKNACTIGQKFPCHARSNDQYIGQIGNFWLHTHPT
jgi:hypothetical protein